MEIVTPRFLLRDFTEDERQAFVAYHADPRYLAFSGREEADPDRPQRLFQTFRDWSFEQPRRNYQLAIVQRQQPQALVFRDPAPLQPLEPFFTKAWRPSEIELIP